LESVCVRGGRKKKVVSKGQERGAGKATAKRRKWGTIIDRTEKKGKVLKTNSGWPPKKTATREDRGEGGRPGAGNVSLLLSIFSCLFREVKLISLEAWSTREEENLGGEKN